MASIGERIKIKRKELGLTQAELGEKLNVSDKAVSKWEQGEGDPNLSIIPDIAKILNVSLDYLLLGQEEEKITLDDMDGKKRLSYIFKKDDLDAFVKYDYLNDSTIWRLHGSAISSLVQETWKEMIDKHAAKIFVYCCDEMIKKCQNNDWQTHLVASFIDDYIKMVDDIDKPKYLETIGFKFLAVGQDLNTNHHPNFTKYADMRNMRPQDTFYIKDETLEYIFINAKKSPKCFEYVTTLEFGHKYPTNNNFIYRYTFMERHLVELAVQYKYYDAIIKIKSAYERELENAQQYNDTHTGINNTYVYYDEIIRARVLAFDIDIIKGLLLVNLPLAKELNAYNEKIVEMYKGFGEPSVKIKNGVQIFTNALGIQYMSEHEMERYIKLNSDLPETEKTKIRCINNGILCLGEVLENVRDLKLVKEILDESIYNPYEIAYEYYKKNDLKSLYKMMIDQNQIDAAQGLISGEWDRKKYAINCFFYYLLDQRNPIGKAAKEQISQEAIQRDYGFQVHLKDDPRTGKKNVWNASEEWREAEKKYEYEKLYEYCVKAKQEVYDKIKKILDDEKAKKQFERERIKAKKGLSKDYFLELLDSGKQKDERLFIIDLCSLFDAILKYDYECEGEDLFERMTTYYNSNAPKSRTCDDGWGYEVLDETYENEVVKPWHNTWDLMSRLRKLRNNLTHPELNDVEPLTHEELAECLEYVFSINKEEE